MMDEDSPIPIIDFKHYNINSKIDDIQDEDLQSLSKHMFDALHNVGACYIKNHGVKETSIKNVFRESKQFFNLPDSTKEIYRRGQGLNNHGYIGICRESLLDGRPGDIKEVFNFTPIDEKEWPTDDVPGMKESIGQIFGDFCELGSRVINLLSLGLGLEEGQLLRNYHKNIGKCNNLTTLRTLHYPPLPDDIIIKPGQTRAGEHCDYRSLTFLLQDEPGLEICTRDGKYVHTSTDPGLICVIVGYALERFTSDKLKATKHRVSIPEDEQLRKKSRQSVTFFIHPDNDVIIQPLDGSKIYEPVNAVDYVENRFNELFKPDDE